MQKALTATETRTAICCVFYFQGFVVKIHITIARLSTKRHAQNNTELNTYTTLTLIITLLYAIFRRWWVWRVVQYSLYWDRRTEPNIITC